MDIFYIFLALIIAIYFNIKRIRELKGLSVDKFHKSKWISVMLLVIFIFSLSSVENMILSGVFALLISLSFAVIATISDIKIYRKNKSKRNLISLISANLFWVLCIGLIIHEYLKVI